MSKSKQEFEQRILPHLGAAYSLARWLLRHPQDAEDAVQEAVLKAFKAFHGYEGGSAQAWLLTIVRNTCLTAIGRRRTVGKVIVLQDVVDERDKNRIDALPDMQPLPDVRLMQAEDRRRVHAAVAALPEQFREVLVLREFHDLNYREIADIVGAPVGTVMSRLSRAREKLKEVLVASGDAAETGKVK